MKNPKLLNQVDAWTYEVPTYIVTDEGMQDGAAGEIRLCRGDRADATKPRQQGMFTETLLETCRQYLTAVNVGELASRETAMAITKIDEALMWIGKRAEDRKLREVQGTYQK